MQVIQEYRIQIDNTASVPIFKQVCERIKQGIASTHLKPGQRLPPIRKLAQSLGVNPGTVARAYLELEREKVVMSRRGGGTVVVARANDAIIHRVRAQHLSQLVNNHILEALSLGYAPEELEAEFSLHLSRWREERKSGNVSTSKRTKAAKEDTLVIVGSHDLALDLLVSKLKALHPEAEINLNAAGSLGGLIALQEGRADMAGIHLLDKETGEYNYPYLKHLLPERELVVIQLAYRIQGLIVAPGNPRNIKDLNDIGNPGISFVNRQKGSGTRLLLDLELRKHGIATSRIKGYSREVSTHLAVALSIARGEADVGLGIQAAAVTNGLEFIPLLKERYDLIIPGEKFQQELMQNLLEIVNSREFKLTVENIGGYDVSQTGSMTRYPYKKG